MSILDRFKKKSANSIVSEYQYINFDSIINSMLCKKRYADAYLWMIYNKIFAGLQNVKFTIKDESMLGVGKSFVNNVFAYIERNLAQIVFMQWMNGFVVFERLNDGIRIVDYKRIQRDINGKVIGYDIVSYSNEYLFCGRTALNILSENINGLDAFKNAELYLTQSLGAFGILSGKQTPIIEKEKKKLLADIKEMIGITDNKVQFLISQDELSFQQVDFKIKELELSEKVKNELMLIAGYFNVPYDLIPFSGQSTYANQKESKILFYENCISALAKVGLQIIQMAVKSSKDVFVRSDDFKFKIINVPELQEDKTSRIDYLQKVVNVAKGAEELGCDISEYKRELQRYGRED